MTRKSLMRIGIILGSAFPITLWILAFYLGGIYDKECIQCNLYPGGYYGFCNGLNPPPPNCVALTNEENSALLWSGILFVLLLLINLALAVRARKWGWFFVVLLAPVGFAALTICAVISMLREGEGILEFLGISIFVPNLLFGLFAFMPPPEAKPRFD
jgi:hypothetical protein